MGVKRECARPRYVQQRSKTLRRLAKCRGNYGDRLQHLRRASSTTNSPALHVSRHNGSAFRFALAAVESLQIRASCSTSSTTEYPETGTALLSPRGLYELAEVPSPQSSRYSNMLFYGAIIGAVIIIKSVGRSRAEPSGSRVSSDYLVFSVTLFVEFVLWLSTYFSCQ